MPIAKSRANFDDSFARVAASHIRIGSFEYFAARMDTEAIEILVRYTPERHYPGLTGAENPALALLESAVRASRSASERASPDWPRWDRCRRSNTCCMDSPSHSGTGAPSKIISSGSRITTLSGSPILALNVARLRPLRQARVQVHFQVEAGVNVQQAGH
ncbi:MAG: protein adenylyltransferase SelO family protein [Haliea sp.]